VTRLNAFRWAGAAVATLTLAGAFAAALGTRRFAERRYAERTAASAAAYLALATPGTRGTPEEADAGELLGRARALSALPGWTADLEVYLGTAPLIRGTDPPLALATVAALAPGSAPRWIDGAAFAPLTGPVPGRSAGAVRIRPRAASDPFEPWLTGLLGLTACAGLAAAAHLHRRRGTWWLGAYAAGALAFGGVAAGAAVTGMRAATARWLRETAVLVQEAGSRVPRAPWAGVVTTLRPIAADGRLAVDTTGGPGEEGAASAGPTAPRFLWFGADRWLTLEAAPEDWAAAARDGVAGTAALAGVLALLALSWGATDRVPPGQTEQTLSAWSLLAPAGAHLATLTVAPLVVLGYVAVHHWERIGGPAEYVGWGNLVAVALRPDTWAVLGRTALFALHVPVAVAVALALALGSRAAPTLLIRALLVVPPFVSLTAFAVVWRLGLAAWSPLQGPGASLWVAAGAATVLQIGYQVPVFLAGLDRIPVVLWEAAALDGARGWSRFRLLTGPLLAPVIRCALITGLALGVQVFTLGYVTGQGRPDGDFVAGRIVRLGWVDGRLDLAASLSLLFLVLVLALVLLQVRLWRRETDAA